MAVYDASRWPKVMIHWRKRDASVERDPGAGVFVKAAAGTRARVSFQIFYPFGTSYWLGSAGLEWRPSLLSPPPLPPSPVDAIGFLREYLRNLGRAFTLGLRSEGGELAAAAGEPRLVGCPNY